MTHELLNNLEPRNIRKISKNALRQSLVCRLPNRNKTVAKKSNNSVPTPACEENIYNPGRWETIFWSSCNVYTWKLNKAFLDFGTLVHNQNALVNWIQNWIPEAHVKLEPCQISMMELIWLSAFDYIWKKKLPS